MILSNFHEAGVDTIDWLKTFKQAYHINLRFDPIGKLKQLLIKDHIWRGHTNFRLTKSHHQYLLVNFNDSLKISSEMIKIVIK